MSILNQYEEEGIDLVEIFKDVKLAAVIILILICIALIAPHLLNVIANLP